MINANKADERNVHVMTTLFQVSLTLLPFTEEEFRIYLSLFYEIL